MGVAPPAGDRRRVVIAVTRGRTWPSHWGKPGLTTHSPQSAPHQNTAASDGGVATTSKPTGGVARRAEPAVPLALASITSTTNPVKSGWRARRIACHVAATAPSAGTGSERQERGRSISALSTCGPASVMCATLRAGWDGEGGAAASTPAVAKTHRSAQASVDLRITYQTAGRGDLGCAASIGLGDYLAATALASYARASREPSRTLAPRPQRASGLGQRHARIHAKGEARDPVAGTASSSLRAVAPGPHPRLLFRRNPRGARDDGASRATGTKGPAVEAHGRRNILASGWSGPSPAIPPISMVVRKD